MGNTGYKRYIRRVEVFINILGDPIIPYEYTGNSEPNIDDGDRYIGDVYNTTSCPLSTVPGAPTSLSSSTITTSTFTLSWTAPSNDGGETITDYKIYKGGAYYGSVGSASTSKGITGQTAESTDTWTVKAVNSKGDSVASSGLSVTLGSETEFSMSQTGASLAEVCAEFTNWTRYHDGAGSLPVNGDIIYTDSAGTTTFNGGSSYYKDSGWYRFRVSSTGVVDAHGSCD